MPTLVQYKSGVKRIYDPFFLSLLHHYYPTFSIHLTIITTFVFTSRSLPQHTLSILAHTYLAHHTSIRSEDDSRPTMSPDVLDLISSQMKQVKKAEFAHWNIFLTDHNTLTPKKIQPLLVRYFEEWHGLYSRWAPADLDDVAVGTPGSAARRHEKKTVVPYRSYEVKESVNMVSTPPIINIRTTHF
ncbi:hypothetical protein EV368DRAFT_83423 [Lentinula lateritia]|nr:hypothetical protein EV368DRAFT_83423 [Lentinula lateritia]